ncbi:MAG: hypothetical protein CM1200mP2_11820 [Planctomycetaceae bacterium]|nr:MAG: hypothetical protein CM1200mP2_11820 [Planctomycetaceae bacterium]
MKGQRVNALDLQFSHRIDTDPAVRAIRVGLDLTLEPVDRWIVGAPASLGRARVLGEVEIDVERVRLPDSALVNHTPGLDQRRQEIAIPHHEPHVVFGPRGDHPVAFRNPVRHWLVLHHVQTKPRTTNSQVTVPLGLGTDDRHLHVVIGHRLLDSLHVGDAVLVGVELVSLVNPVGLIGVSQTTTRSNRGCVTTPLGT